MLKSSLLNAAALLVAGLMISVGAPETIAQSGSGYRPQPASGSAGGSAQQGQSAQKGSGYSGSGQSGSGNRGLAAALDGYCAVCLVEKTEWVAGKPQFQVSYDGKSYRFPGAEQMERFRADPIRYTPVLGGDDVVEFANNGRRVTGQTKFGSKYKGRFFFFASAANKQLFSANPRMYADADLALGGDCVVCKVDLNSRMPGDPNVAAMHDGMRFFFAGDQQRQKFFTTPVRYASVALKAGSGSRGSGSAAGSGNSAGSGSSRGSGSSQGSGSSNAGSESRGSGAF